MKGIKFITEDKLDKYLIYSALKDLVPPAYLDELSLLQDRISPFSTEVAFNMIEQELGLPIEEVFSEISPEPVAAASLGQVFIYLLKIFYIYHNIRMGHLFITSQAQGVASKIYLSLYDRYIKLGSAEMERLLQSKCRDLVYKLPFPWIYLYCVFWQERLRKLEN